MKRAAAVALIVAGLAAAALAMCDRTSVKSCATQFGACTFNSTANQTIQDRGTRCHCYSNQTSCLTKAGCWNPYETYYVAHYSCLSDLCGELVCGSSSSLLPVSMISALSLVMSYFLAC